MKHISFFFFFSRFGKHFYIIIIIIVVTTINNYFFVDHNFTDAVVGLKKGQVSKPFRSRFGWHVVKLEDGPRPVAKPEPYEALSEAAQQAIRQKTAQLQLEALTEKLASNAKVARADAPARNTKTSFNR